MLQELEAETGAVSSYISRHPLPAFTKEMVFECIEKVEKQITVSVDKKYIWEFLWTGYAQTPLVKE